LGTLNPLDNGKFSIISNGTTMGTGMFHHSPNGQKIMVIDLQNYINDKGRGMIFGVPQVTANLGGDLDGTYHFNNTLGQSGSVSTLGEGFAFSGENGQTGTMIADSPWTGMVEAAGGYAMIADEGVFMLAPKVGMDETFLVIGSKEQ
jgi:hypothetical protein